MKLNMDWPSVKRDDTGSWPPANPNWFKQQEMMAQLGPMMGMMGGGGGKGGGGSGGKAVLTPLRGVSRAASTGAGRRPGWWADEPTGS